MKVYLVQHAKAKSKEEDPERPLSAAGRADIGKVAAYLAQNASLNIYQIYHSGKTRARQTAEILSDALHPAAELQEAADLQAMDDPSIWAKELPQMNGDVMLVGHKPYMPRLAGLLVCQDEEKQVVDFQKGGVVCLNRDSDEGWLVHWIVTPDVISSGTVT